MNKYAQTNPRKQSIMSGGRRRRRRRFALATYREHDVVVLFMVAIAIIGAGGFHMRAEPN